jgi:CheY-like chemotaxis protein
VAKVLVVEDESLISMLVEEALQDAGHTVVTAANAAAAIVKLETDPTISLVFTDVNMPGEMDGLKLAAYVRNRWPPVHIVIASGKRRPAEHEMPGGSVFLAKPYITRQVTSAVEGFFQG